MPWRETTVFFYLWLALLLFLSLRVLAIESGLAHYPYLNPLEVTYQLTVILFLPPAVAALASLSLPVRGEPLAAFLLGFSTYALSPAPGAPLAPALCLARRCTLGGWLYAALALALNLLWGLGCALLARSEDPRDVGAAVGFFLLFGGWLVSFTFLPS